MRLIFVFVLIFLIPVALFADYDDLDESKHSFSTGIAMGFGQNMSVMDIGFQYSFKLTDDFWIGFPLRWFDQKQDYGFDITTLEAGVELKYLLPKMGGKKGQGFIFSLAALMNGDFSEEDNTGATIAKADFDGMRIVAGGGYQWKKGKKGMVTGIQIGIEYLDLDISGGYTLSGNREPRLHWAFTIGYVF